MVSDKNEEVHGKKRVVISSLFNLFIHRFMRGITLTYLLAIIPTSKQRLRLCPEKVSEQFTLKPGCAALADSWRLEMWDLET